MNLSREKITDSLRIFKNRRDALLHEDAATFDHCLDRFIKFCKEDFLVKKVLDPIQDKIEVNAENWWVESLRKSKLSFPSDSDEELLLRFKVLEHVAQNGNQLVQFGVTQGGRKKDDWIALFLTLIVQPFVDELSHRLGDAANMASPDVRSLQAVPLERIPTQKEVKIFLSHKSVDKSRVYRYYHALKKVGFDPWLDEPNLAAGANLERELFKGFEESCAAVFFITENFKDEAYLATEVDYAIMQKRKKNKKFAIITLRYSDAVQIPDLLTPYVYRNVENDLEGFYELLKALPLELGPMRWKAEVVH
jgi:TIR domain